MIINVKMTINISNIKTYNLENELEFLFPKNNLAIFVKNFFIL